jgi:phage terminase large subunit GpA-like protein
VTTRRGFQKLEWQKLGERNEVLDCRVYARAAAWIAGADRWSGAKWRGLEDQLGPAPGQTDSNRAGDEPAPVTAGMLARAPRATGTRRSTWLAVDKGWLK